MEKIIRTGIIGFGLSGRVFHAPFIDVGDGFELTKISTSNSQSISIIEERYPVTAIVPGGKGIIDDPDINLVIVTSPNTVHFHWAREALLAGKHVVVEKPFTVSVKEADELIEIAKRVGKILTVYHNRRITSDTKTVRRLLDSKILGDIVDYETHFDRYRPEPRPGGAWREDALPGSGIFYDLGSHLIDQALYFFGMPLSVTADIKAQRPWAKADDYFDLRLQYPTFTATLKAGMLKKIPGPTYQIHGKNGSFVKYGLDVQEENLNNGAIPNTPSWGSEPENIWGTIDVEREGLKLSGKIESERGDYRVFFNNLRDAIWGKAEIAVKPEEARDVMRIIELSFLSSREKRTVEVKL
ncbi:MAG: oxidoreductase [Dysgonamonadaceae bacterium]|jgi:predicted dehydrogenase|nr:oxidoreductase [Dysgonamonadaceae bacterium]